MARSVPAFLVTLIVAAMIGLRESTGIGPPPPVGSIDTVEWLSPELDGDDQLPIDLQESSADPEDATARPAKPARQGFFRTILRAVGLLNDG